MALGRREKNLHPSIRRLQIPAAILIGIIVGCAFAFLFLRIRTVSVSNIEVDQTAKKIHLLESTNKRLSYMNVQLNKKVKDLDKFVLHNETINPRLAKILAKLAVGKEIMVALANSHVKSTLKIWFTTIKKLAISNYLVVALDDEILNFCEENGVPVYRRDRDYYIDSIGKSENGRAVSGLKFRVLREFLQLGYSVLLSDVDIVFLQNPFDHLYRDVDVESMSDGHSNTTAYGFDDIVDDRVNGWVIYTTRIWVYNSGFFYIRPTVPSIELLDRVARRLDREKDAWDQVVFNEELFYPSRPDYVGLNASKRTMDFYLFMNSKVLFTIVRKDGVLKQYKHVVVHMNYHHDKSPRMEAIVEFYLNGKQDALDHFRDGDQ